MLVFPYLRRCVTAFALQGGEAVATAASAVDATTSLVGTVGLLYSILMGQAYGFLYGQQEVRAYCEEEEWEGRRRRWRFLPPTFLGGATSSDADRRATILRTVVCSSHSVFVLSLSLPRHHLPLPSPADMRARRPRPSFSRLFAALSVAAAAATHEDNDVSSSALPPPLTSLMCTLEAFLLMDVLVNLETEGGGATTETTTKTGKGGRGETNDRIVVVAIVVVAAFRWRSCHQRRSASEDDQASFQLRR